MDNKFVGDSNCDAHVTCDDMPFDFMPTEKELDEKFMESAKVEFDGWFDSIFAKTFECDCCGRNVEIGQKNADGYGNYACDICINEWKNDEPQEWRDSPLYDGCFDDDDCDDIIDDHHADQEFDYRRLTR